MSEEREPEAVNQRLEAEMQNVPKFVLQRLRQITPAAESHPDADLLTAFAEQSLAGRERLFVMEHLARCGDCRDVVAHALPATEIVSIPAAASSVHIGFNQGWFSWPVFRWGALAAGILAVTSVGVLQYSHHNHEKIVASNLVSSDVATDGRKLSKPISAPPNETQRDALSVHKAAAGVAAGPRTGGANSSGSNSLGKIGSGSGVHEVSPRTESTATDQNQLAQNHVEPPLQHPSITSLDVVKAKDPVPAEAAPGSSPAPAFAPPSLPLQTSPSLMLRSSPRWSITPAGGLQRSFDGGNTWENVTPSAGGASSATSGGAGADKKNQKAEASPNSIPVFRTVAANRSEVWAGATGGILYHSSDGGNRWALTVPTDSVTILTGDIISIQFSDPQYGKIATSTGELWITFDAGLTWGRPQ